MQPAQDPKRARQTVWYREAGHREEFLQAVFTPQGAQHLSVKQMHTASVNYNLPAERSHNGCVVRRRDGCGNGRLHPTVRGACSLARSANLIHTVRSHRRYVRTRNIANPFKSGVRSSKISSRGSAPHPARAHALDPRRVTIDNILLPGRVGNYWTNIFDKFRDP